MKKMFCLLIFFFSGCSSTISGLPLNIECRTENDVCPTDLDCEMNIFSDAVPGFDMTQPLTVYYYDYGAHPKYCTRTKCYNASGFAPNDHEIYVAGITFISHELIHTQLWRIFKDGDNDHEIGDGPWREAYNELSRNLRIKMDEECSRHE